MVDVETPLKDLRNRFFNDQTRVTDWFASSPDRANRFSVIWEDLCVDFSKQKVNETVLATLWDLATKQNLTQKKADLISGKYRNLSEDRPVFHTALRDLSDAPLMLGEENIKPKLQAVRAFMRTFSDSMRAHRELGVTERPLKQVLCLGIGGSDLGPRLVCEALAPYRDTDLNLYFVSNMDGETLSTTLSQLNPDETLCIISSKTFSTLETLVNAEQVKKWFLAAFLNQTWENVAARHFAAVTAAPEKAKAWGVTEERIFRFWPWVGGRYSVWSAVGLPIALSIGMEGFEAFLSGAHAMDQHFLMTPWRQNLPVLMGLIGIWNRNGLSASTQAILPYADGLSLLPAYLQQLEMESNGKRVDQTGQPITHATGPIVWGGVGCDGQHAFFQWLHQGTEPIPVDFWVPIHARQGDSEAQILLVANALSQSRALMLGCALDDLRKACPGDRPSTTLMFSCLTPRMLGKLLSLYEHKVFVQGILWGINSFDQWGVELGKSITQSVLPLLKDPTTRPNLDPSTEALIAFFHQQRRTAEREEPNCVSDRGNRRDWDGDLPGTASTGC